MAWLGCGRSGGKLCALLMVWKALPVSQETAVVKLGVYVGTLMVVGLAA